MQKSVQFLTTFEIDRKYL